MKILICILLSGCTHVQWSAADGTKLDAWSILSNKKVVGSLKDGNRTLTIKELTEDQTTGAAEIVGAAVEAAVKGVKP